MDTKPIITIEVPEITDATYQINPDKDVKVIITPPPEDITDPVLSDGSVLIGTFQKQSKATSTTLGEIKQKITILTERISANNKENVDNQTELDALNVQLTEVQPLVDNAVVGWKPTPIETPPEQLPVEKIL